jgi:hypothetical protein
MAKLSQWVHPAPMWDVVQAEFYKDTRRSCCSPVLWLAGLINQMWNLSQAMWNHRNVGQHATLSEIALSLEASVDQSIQDHFTQGFNDLHRRHSSPFYLGGLRYILSKPFRYCGTRTPMTPSVVVLDLKHLCLLNVLLSAVG